MKEIKDLTAKDLKQEGRRWVLYPAEHDGQGYRARIVFENHPYPFTLGEISNRQTAGPPLYLFIGDEGTENYDQPIFPR